MYASSLLALLIFHAARCVLANEASGEKRQESLEDYFTQSVSRWVNRIGKGSLPTATGSDLERSRHLLEEALWKVVANEQLALDHRCDAVAAIGRLGPRTTISRLAKHILRLRRQVLDRSSLLYEYPCAGALLLGGPDALPAMLTADVLVASDDEAEILAEIHAQATEAFFARMGPNSANYRLVAIRYLECLECAEWQRPHIADVLNKIKEHRKVDVEPKRAN
jgi:hypothetical protein